MLKLFLFLFLYFSFILHAFSQCCSMGIPTGSSEYVGIVEKNKLRVTTFGRYNFFDTYFEGSHASAAPSILEKSFFYFAGITLSYGITQRLTLESENGYFINKSQIFNVNNKEYKLRGFGLTNGVLSIKYGILNNLKTNVELTAGIGLKYPFTAEPLYVEGKRVPVDLQPSTNAFGFSLPVIFIKSFPNHSLRVISLNKYDHNFSNPENYTFGSAVSNSVIVSKKMYRNLNPLFQIRSEFRRPDTNNSGNAVNTGAHIVLSSFQCTYSVQNMWHITTFFDIPVYQNYSGKQLAQKFSMGISITREFEFRKKQGSSIQ